MTSEATVKTDTPGGIAVEGTPYRHDATLVDSIRAIDTRVAQLRAAGPLPTDVVDRLRHYLRVRNIYHSNAIEGNRLTIGETRGVIEDGLTIAGKPTRDQAEARNLALALDYLETLAADRVNALTEADIKQLHSIVLKDIDVANAGRYRTISVTIGGATHQPPTPDEVPGEMKALCDWLAAASIPKADQSGLLVAAAAHTWFVTVHPFVDGNGRTARLLMDLALIRYGYPVIVITLDQRQRYYEALQRADTGDLTGVLRLFIDASEDAIQELETAIAQHHANLDWAIAVAESFSHDEQARMRNEYEVWKASMTLIRSQFLQVVQLINQHTKFGRIFFREFELPEFEQYARLRLGQSARWTWFFRTDFRSGERAARYLFSFGFPSPDVRKRSGVSIHVAREQAPFSYTRLDKIGSSNVPNFVEFAYEATTETWLARRRDNELATLPVEAIAREFINDVVRLDFGST
jgi:Fic family protein